MKKIIPLSVPNLAGNEKKYVLQALEEEWVSTAGPFINEFEQDIADYTGASYAVACQSGTAGLHLSLIANGIGSGDEVIVPALTFIAAVNPVRYTGAQPVFMDCDDSLTMDPEKLESFCKDECILQGEHLINKKTGCTVKALIIVHVFGNLADMESIMDIALKYHLKVIEDATEALGGYYCSGLYKKRFAGTIGDAGVYSFNGNKIITTGGGGMVVTASKKIAERIKHLSTQAKTDTLYFDHDEIGYNYRMTNIQAAVGKAQLEQLEKFIEIKTANYNRYIEEGIPLLDFKNGTRPNFWFYSYLCDRRDELIGYLESRDIQSRPVWKLIHTLKPYQACQSFKIQKAVMYYNKIVNIPCSTSLSGEEVHKVAEKITEFKEGALK